MKTLKKQQLYPGEALPQKGLTETTPQSQAQ